MPSGPLAVAVCGALPQTQCTRCGYADCAAYAQAIVAGDAGIDRCPPGGAEGIRRLSVLTGRPPGPLDPACGTESPRRLAVIDEGWCIGCTLCVQACPVDCIVGAPKSMHAVIEADCTGCELCLPVCPVDCIALVPSEAGERTGWSAWSEARAAQAAAQYAARRARLQREADETADRKRIELEAKLRDLPAASRLTDPELLSRKRELAEAALARARARQAGTTAR